MPVNPDMQLALDAEAVPHVATGYPAFRCYRNHIAILQVLSDYGSLTDEEIVSRTAKAGNSIRPRRLELSRHLYVEPVDRVRTPSGRFATRWAITDRGRELLRGDHDG